MKQKQINRKSPKAIHYKNKPRKTRYDKRIQTTTP